MGAAGTDYGRWVKWGLGAIGMALISFLVERALPLAPVVGSAIIDNASVINLGLTLTLVVLVGRLAVRQR